MFDFKVQIREDISIVCPTAGNIAASQWISHHPGLIDTEKVKGVCKNQYHSAKVSVFITSLSTVTCCSQWDRDSCSEICIFCDINSHGFSFGCSPQMWSYYIRIKIFNIFWLFVTWKSNNIIADIEI